MPLVKLSLAERRVLVKQLHETKEVKILHKSQALLWLSQGISVSEIAQQLGVNRRTISYWVASDQN